MEKRNWKSWVCASVVILGLTVATSGMVGCGALGTAGIAAKADVLQSDRPRLPALPLDEARVPELVAGNTQFALDLYRVLFDAEQNLFYSPYSISQALAMTFAGARGETARQMAQALHFSLPQAQLHHAFNALDQALASRAEREDVSLHNVNAIWGQQGYAFLNTFLDTLAENYGAGMRLLDFRKAEQARCTINQWVSDQTQRRIQELLPPNSVSGATALVLTHAVYFKAAWQQPFFEAYTKNKPFSLLDGSRISVPTMSQRAWLGYAEEPGVQVVELPYAGNGLSMVILLPEQGRFESFARSLDGQKVAALLERLEWSGVALTMPRFRFDAAFGLKQALMTLGMVEPFGAANFSGMDGTRELFIDQVYHNTFVAVDEAGTEATAATAVVMNRKSGPPLQHEVSVDRSFVFLVRDIDTGTVLFLGHVVNPAA
jgi:serpin B